MAFLTIFGTKLDLKIVIYVLQVPVGNHGGSSPFVRTKKDTRRLSRRFFIFGHSPCLLAVRNAHT